MGIADKILEKYLNTDRNNFSLADFTVWFTNEFKNKKYKVGTVNLNNNIIEISIIKEKDVFNLMTIEFTVENNMISNIGVFVNGNLIILENDRFLNNFFQKEKD